MSRRNNTPVSAFSLGTLRTVRGTLKRFVALATITALGVIMFVGLMIACADLRDSADRFFDSQSLFDIRVQSTLGLTDEDVEALADLDGVEAAEGGYVETVYTTVGSTSEKVDVKAVSETGMNEPQVLEGRLPERSDEVAVTRRFLEDSGLYLGDRVTFRAEGDGDDAADDADATDATDGDATSDSTDADATDGDATSDATDASTSSIDDLLASDDSSAVFERQEYTIVGVVLDPMDINAGKGTMSFRSSGSSQYSFFVTADAVRDDVVGTYTVAYLRVAGAADPLCYSDEYEELVDEVKQSVEDAREERERARGEALRADANAQIDDAEADAAEQISDAQGQIDDAQEQIDDGSQQLDDARQTLQVQETSATAQLDAAERQIEAGYAQIEAAEQELALSEQQVNEGLSVLAAGLGCSVDGIEDALSENHDTLVASRAQIETSVQILSALLGDSWPSDAWNRLDTATDAATAQAAAAEVSAVIDPYVSRALAAIDALISYASSDEFQQLQTNWENFPDSVKQDIYDLIAQAPEALQPTLLKVMELDADQVVAKLESLRSQVSQLSQLAPGMVQVVEGEISLATAQSSYEQLKDGQAQIADGKAQIEAARAELDSGATELSEQTSSALAQIADGYAQIEENAATLADSQAELDDAQAELDEQAADAASQIADARDQVSQIEDATWYVQDRSSLSSYASVESDASSIETIGTVLPIIFFIVAVLISLTTMTRMVEEERGLIGLYKALGYGRARILSKYVLYAAAGCLAGGVVGNFCGFVVLPLILFTIFSTMYALPQFYLGFNLLYALCSTALFAVGIVGATFVTCRRELRETPAALMRPKAPKAGSRIVLERIGPLWRRLGFLSKVTARNIFRYKKRFFMTLFGIAGTTALLVTGFGIRDTVISLSGRQYGDEGVVRYDLVAAASADDLDAAADELASDAQVTDLVRVYTDSVTVSYGDSKESLQLIVVPTGTNLTGYLEMCGEDGAVVELADGADVAVTINAAQVMGFSEGDSLELQDSTLATGTVSADAVFTSYLGNILVMTEEAYESAFGADLAPNAVLAHLSGSADDQVAFAERLSQDSRYLSVVATQKLVSDFSGSFTLINTVVYVVIVLAGALAFTVVFTLSNTNISERERELATIKVLGFKRGEVHRYINKETLLLTGAGALCGLPLGYAVARSLTYILKMPSLYFDVVVDPVTYVVAVAMAFAFTLVVNRLTDRSLDRIDMVGALKSAE